MPAPISKRLKAKISQGLSNGATNQYISINDHCDVVMKQDNSSKHAPS